MKVDKELIEHVAELARLKLTNEEIEKFLPQLKEILRRVKTLEHQGYEFERADASFALLILGILHRKWKSPFKVKSSHISIRCVGKDSINEVTIEMRVGEKFHHEVAKGDGPVNALDRALRKGLMKSFPQLKRVKLVDYSVRILKGMAGTRAKTRVLIVSTDDSRKWTTVGVNENIITASLEALVDSMKFALMPKA